jgi:hypothetical protein
MFAQNPYQPPLLFENGRRHSFSSRASLVKMNGEALFANEIDVFFWWRSHSCLLRGFCERVTGSDWRAGVSTIRVLLDRGTTSAIRSHPAGSAGVRAQGTSA